MRVTKVKYIDQTGENRTGSARNRRNSNTKKRKKLREQAPKYLAYLVAKLEQASLLEAYIFSNQYDQPQRLATLPPN